MWSEPGAVPHLGALDAGGPAHAFGHAGAVEHLVAQAGGADRLTVSRIHDVVCFDGIAYWWAAVAPGAPDASPSATAIETLQPFIAADGIMRISCEAVVLTTAR